MADERHVTVLMVDLAGYTALTEAHGNVEAAHVVARYLALAADATAPGAQLLERVGDGLVFIADRVEAAVRTAVRLRALAAQTPRFPRVRGGLHAGPVAIDEGRYVGHEIVASAVDGETAIDPVCRMQVDPAVDTIEATVGDRRYIYAVRGGADARSVDGQA
jgi:class 3 adenylate cyclase